MQTAISRLWVIVLMAGALLLPQGIYATGELSWVGRIDVRPSGGIAGSWIVRGHTFSATSTTRIQETLGSLSIGACVEVQYASAGSTDTALRIERQLESVCGGPANGGEQTTYALITAIPPGNIGVWNIGGQAYTSTADTTLRQEHGSFAVGVCAEVEFTNANSANTARKIATQEPYHCSNGTFLSRALGTVGAFPAGLIGTWQVGGVQYEATSSTRFQQPSPFAIGSCVKVAYFVQNGVNIAEEIEREDADNCSNTPPAMPSDLRKLYAPIDALPASPFVGAWRIGGVDFSATLATTFDQANTPFAVGVCVEAQYIVDGNLNRLATVESKPLTRCQIEALTVLRAYGPISSFPAGLLGSWVVGGVSFQTSPSTTFEQSFGPFAPGAFVEIIYQVTNSNRIATHIETHVVPGDGRTRTVGVLETRPSDDTGTWVIGGVNYIGDDAIEIELELRSRPTQSALATPLVVMVNGYKAADGTQYATSVTTVYQIFAPTIHS